MDAREGGSVGVTVIGAEAASSYHVAPRTDPTGPPVIGASPVSVGALLKKKRGRPRKYGPDGGINMSFSPLPLSSSAPPCINFSKRGKVREPRQRKSECFGEWIACQPGANFTPHVVTVNTGEDVTMKILSFSQQGPRATCILSANGVISNVTLRQPDSSGGTLTYEGRFEILSLTGSYAPTAETGGTKGRSGGLSVSLASPDGRVVGGGVAGNLVAASPVQVVVGSFLPGNQNEQKVKLKDAPLPQPASYAPPGEDSFARNGFAPPKLNLDEWSASRKSTTDINISLPVG